MSRHISNHCLRRNASSPSDIESPGSLTPAQTQTVLVSTPAVVNRIPVLPLQAHSTWSLVSARIRNDTYLEPVWFPNSNLSKVTRLRWLQNSRALRPHSRAIKSTSLTIPIVPALILQALQIRRLAIACSQRRRTCLTRLALHVRGWLRRLRIRTRLITFTPRIRPDELIAISPALGQCYLGFGSHAVLLSTLVAAGALGEFREGGAAAFHSLAAPVAHIVFGPGELDGEGADGLVSCGRGWRTPEQAA